MGCHKILVYQSYLILRCGFVLYTEKSFRGAVLEKLEIIAQCSCSRDMFNGTSGQTTVGYRRPKVTKVGSLDKTAAAKVESKLDRANLPNDFLGEKTEKIKLTGCLARYKQLRLISLLYSCARSSFCRTHRLAGAATNVLRANRDGRNIIKKKFVS